MRLTKNNIILKTISGYDYADYHRALLGTLSCFAAVLLTMLGHIPISAALWLVLAASLACLSTQGANKHQQSLHFLLLGIFTSISLAFITLCHYFFPWWALTIALSLGTYLLLSLPRLWPSLSIIILLAIAMMIAGASFPIALSIPLPTLLSIQVISMFSGAGITLIINLMLPSLSIDPPSIDSTLYFHKRNFRLSLGILIAFALAHALHLQHASWICFAIVFVSKASIGSSIKRGIERLSGTACGVVLGIPAAIWLFPHVLWFHWVTFALLFCAWINAVRNYFMSMLLFTFIIAAAYFILFPTGGSGVAFIGYRLLDTFIGVMIAIALELSVFPLSLHPCLRKHHFMLWDSLYHYFKQLSDPKTPTLDDYTNHLTQTMNKVDNLLAEMKYEPIGALTLKYHRAKQLMRQLRQLIETLPSNASDLLKAKSFNQAYYEQLLQTLKILTQINFQSSQHDLIDTLLEAKTKQAQVCLLLQNTAGADNQSDIFININKQMLAIIEQYHATRATPKWRIALRK